MARIGCDDCGTTLLKDGVCPNCDEEVVIYRQDPDFPFSDEFLDAVRDGEERGERRERR